ncbi:uncharacterized protein LOC142340247 [Convolutriloba macropyga]|uniref:uncharacterized protein LOC142340247 n=1 Tax=Convolutriloba macropyga TaxID=536237 RepID=UPI003F51D458
MGCDHQTVLIVGTIFSCLLFIMQIVIFCDIECGGTNWIYGTRTRNDGNDGPCWGMYTFSAGSVVNAARAFHVLAFLACMGAIVTWSLMLAMIFDTFEGAICITTLASGCFVFSLISAACWTGWYDGGANMGNGGSVACVWIAFLFSVAPFACALLVILGRSRGGSRGGHQSTHRTTQRHTTRGHHQSGHHR